MRKIKKVLHRTQKKILQVCFYFFLISFSIFADDNSSVDVLLSSNNSVYLSTLQSIQSSSKKNLNLNFTNSMSEKELKVFFSNLENKKANLLITLGPQASLVARENLTTVPILYSLVNAPRAIGFNFATNTCGVHIDVPIQDFFRSLKEIDPQAKVVISIFSNNSGELFANEADYSDSQFGILFQKIKVENKSDFAPILKNLKGKIDAFYLVPDPIYTQENFETISKFAKENKIILMTQIPFIVNVGTTFSITPYYARVGTLVGDLVNEVLSGKTKCKDGYAIGVKEFSLSLNKTYSEESGISLPENIIRRAENSRLLIEGIRFYEKGNLEISILVMEKILKEDPNNYTAFYYRNHINQRINGDKIAEFLERAEEYKNTKNYKKEQELYLQVLKLHPENKRARQGIQDSLFQESESERLSGEKLEALNQPFAALQKYLNSLRILDLNTKAKANLARLRTKETQNISIYTQTGKSLYEVRKYSEAEEMFQNILLVDPENKNVKEYLRLSKEKKIAMLKYENCLRDADKKCYLLWEKK